VVYGAKNWTKLDVFAYNIIENGKRGFIFIQKSLT
jgi:hypothetical protein